MPPKAKAKGGKKKKPAANDKQHELEEALMRSKDEMVALKVQLAVRKDLVRKTRKTEEILQQDVNEAKIVLEAAKQDSRDVTADMTRQYKTMHSELRNKIKVLENELSKTKTKLESTEAELKDIKQAKEKMEKDKEEETTQLMSLINQMTLAYESVLDSALDSLAEKIMKRKPSWDKEATVLHSKHKQILLEFGLNPKEI